MSPSAKFFVNFSSFLLSCSKSNLDVANCGAPTLLPHPLLPFYVCAIGSTNTPSTLSSLHLMLKELVSLIE